MSSAKRAIHYLLHNRCHLADSIVKHLGFLFTDKAYLSLRYRFKMGTDIDWQHPTTFTEKIQWLKVYGYEARFTQMVDKLGAKEYAAERIGRQYIIPTIGVWNTVGEIEWDKLPEQFAIKTTHGGGSGGVVICKSKTTFDIEAAKRKLQTSMDLSAGNNFREKPYLSIPRRIIAEELIADDRGNDLTDYKFFCFGGEPRYCQVIRDRSTHETIDFYDMDWQLAPFVGLNPNCENGKLRVARPVGLETMIEICRKLSAGLPFLRVDLYNTCGAIYFGEMTFYPASGFGRFNPDCWNKKLGDLIELPERN